MKRRKMRVRKVNRSFSVHRLDDPDIEFYGTPYTYTVTFGVILYQADIKDGFAIGGLKDRLESVGRCCPECGQVYYGFEDMHLDVVYCPRCIHFSYGRYSLSISRFNPENYWPLEGSYGQS